MPFTYHIAGNGPPLICIHGWGASARYWAGAFAALSAEHTVIAVDLPGFGAAAPAPGPLNLGVLNDHILALADHLRLDVFDLVGHSLGAGVALLAASHARERVRRLALCSFGLPRDPWEALAMSGLHLQQTTTAMAWAPWLAAQRPWLAATQPLREWFWSSPPWAQLLVAPMISAPVPADMVAVGIADLTRMDLCAAVEGAATSGDPQVAAAATQISAQTLVINGRADPLFPPDSARALASAIPQSNLTLLDNCGHVPMAEQPAQFYGLLQRFLA